MNGSTIAAYDVSDEQLAQFAKWTDGERLQWVWDTANFILGLQTREERIAAYRAKEGKNLKYYDTYGWPEHF